MIRTLHLAVAGERAVTAAMREAGTGLKSAWRLQTTGAGLGTRLANSIRNQNFPRSGESLDVAALVWSKAPVIVSANDTGPLIRSKAGFWLAIPLPAAGKSLRGGRITRMPFASTSLGAEQPLLNSELLGYGRDPLAPIKGAVTADGDVVVPLDAEAFGFWLKAAFGAPTTTGAEAPYSHEFQSGSWTLPSMSIETGMPEGPWTAPRSCWRRSAGVGRGCAMCSRAATLGRNCAAP